MKAGTTQHARPRRRWDENLFLDTSGWDAGDVSVCNVRLECVRCILFRRYADETQPQTRTLRSFHTTLNQQNMTRSDMKLVVCCTRPTDTTARARRHSTQRQRRAVLHETCSTQQKEGFDANSRVADYRTCPTRFWLFVHRIHPKPSPEFALHQFLLTLPWP